jgi:hypothetical protein
MTSVVIAKRHEVKLPKLHAGHMEVAIAELFWNQWLKKFEAKWVYTCRFQKGYQKPYTKMIARFLALGCMRIWSLKKSFNARAFSALESVSLDQPEYAIQS